MAVTSIWPIKGRIEKVINYACNPEKTSEASYDAVSGMHAINDVIEYAADNLKTEHREYVTVLNCTSEKSAAREFVATKRLWHNEGGRACYHGYQSFREDEVDAKTAHEIGVALAKELWGERFQVVVATHCNTGHYHNHFVINSVSDVDGHKFYNSPDDYARMRAVSDRLCREHKLSIIRDPSGKGKNYREWSADKNGNPTVRGTIRKDIDRAIAASTTEMDFIRVMTEMGYEIKTRGESGQPLKYPGIKPPGAKGYFRFHKLGEGYSLDEVKDRIYRNIHKTDPFPEMEDKTAEEKYSHYLEKGKKASGIYRLYLYYCYELHIIEVHPAHLKRVSFAMRQDLQKLDKLDEQTRFLGRNGINTIDDLSKYREHASNDLDELTMRRTELRNELKRATRNGSEKTIQSIKDKITDATTEMRRIRKELSMCDSIEQRSVQIEREMEEIDNQEKEKTTDEQLFRGTGRTGSEVVPRRS